MTMTMAELSIGTATLTAPVATAAITAAPATARLAQTSLFGSAPFGDSPFGGYVTPRTATLTTDGASTATLTQATM